MLHLLTSLALSAELSEYWRPAGLPSNALLAQTGLVVADLDHDGTLDQVAEYITDEAQPQGGFVATLSSRAETYVVPTGDEVMGFHLDSLDIDGDGFEELVVTQDDLDDGDFFVLDVAFFEDPDTIDDSLMLYIQGDGGSEAGFTTAWAAMELDGDARPELIISQRRSPGATFSFDVPEELPLETEPAERALMRWHGLGTGWGVIPLPDLDGQGLPDIALAACPSEEPACGGSAGLVVVSGENWMKSERELTALTVKTDATEAPDRPFAWRDADADGVPEVAWPVSDGLHFVSPVSGELGKLDLPGRVHELRAGDADLDGLDDLWVLEDAGLSLYVDPLNDSTPLEQIATFGGQLLAELGDVDGDGCDEVLVSVPSEGVIYQVDSACFTDTGPIESLPESEPPESDPPESEPPESDPPSESEPPESEADSGPGPFVCEPEYGWTCGSTGAAGAALVLMLLGLGLLRRGED